MSIYVAPRVVPSDTKAGPVGPGAGVLQTEYLLPMMLPTDPQRKQRMALGMYETATWVRAAEQTVSDAVSKMPWHLEDPEGETITDEYPDKRAIEAWNLCRYPQANLDSKVKRTRRQITEITSRHMGLAGTSFWFLDAPDKFGIPNAIIYIRPDRLSPQVDKPGNLLGWLLDSRNGNGRDGTPLSIEEVVPFYLQAPDEGYLAVGLVESSILKIQLSGGIDKHLGSMVSSGGRLSGMYAPKGGPITDDGTWDQLVRDFRNISEQPDAAKRVALVRAPMEYTRTQQTLDEMAIVDLLTKNRDEQLATWRVPLSQIGGYSPAGLNSGDVRKYDYQALIQNAVSPRLDEISETIQINILDKYIAYIGWAPTFIFDTPEFDEDSPRFDKLQKAQFIALTEDERRGLIGYDPLDPALIGPTGQPMGQEIWRPNTQSPVGIPGQPLAQEPGGVAQAVTVPAWSAYQPSVPAGQGGNQPPNLPQKAKPVTDNVLPAVLAALRKQWPDNELTIVDQGDWTFDPTFPLKKINAARRPIARNPRIVAGARAVIAIGAPIAPVTIIHTKVIGKKGYEPIDGWHRVAAANDEGCKTIPAYVGEGDADWTTKLIAFDDDIPTPPDSAPNDPATKAAGGSFRATMLSLRSTLNRTHQPILQHQVALVLSQQKQDIINRVTAHYEAIKSAPKDRTLWWNRSASWDAKLANAMKPVMNSVASAVHDHISASLPARKASPIIAPAGAVNYVLNRGAARVTQINAYTQEELAAIIASGIEAGQSPAELGDAIGAWSGWDEYRAERIATTELADAYNAAALGSYDEIGVTEVEATDGDGDEECAARDGQTFSIDDAADIEDHPNGTLDWIPVIGTMGEPTDG